MLIFLDPLPCNASSYAEQSTPTVLRVLQIPVGVCHDTQPVIFSSGRQRLRPCPRLCFRQAQREGGAMPRLTVAEDVNRAAMQFNDGFRNRQP